MMHHELQVSEPPRTPEINRGYLRWAGNIAGTLILGAVSVYSGIRTDCELLHWQVAGEFAALGFTAFFGTRVFDGLDNVRDMAQRQIRHDQFNPK